MDQLQPPPGKLRYVAADYLPMPHTATKSRQLPPDDSDLWHVPLGCRHFTAILWLEAACSLRQQLQSLQA